MITGRCKICLFFKVPRPGMGTRGTFPGSDWGMNLITHLTLMLRFFYMALWHVQEQPHFYLLLFIYILKVSFLIQLLLPQKQLYLSTTSGVNTTLLLLKDHTVIGINIKNILYQCYSCSKTKRLILQH
jgi:hypothetical protein